MKENPTKNERFFTLYYKDFYDTIVWDSCDINCVNGGVEDVK